MQCLKQCGIRWSIDDFGTGYSSLKYLQRLPIDELKIDRAFINELLVSDNDRRIARAIITLAEELELDVIAEGVENEGQRQFLFKNRCRAYQGYLFSVPASIDVFERETRRMSSAAVESGPYGKMGQTLHRARSMMPLRTLPRRVAAGGSARVNSAEQP